MSRSRAAPPRGAGFRQSKRERTDAQRNWVRGYKRHLAMESKPTLAERVLPWKRLKAKREAQKRERARDLVTQQEQQERDYCEFRRTHRRGWRGILSVSERRRLYAIAVKRIENGEAKSYEHPQRRRIERMERSGRPISTWPGAV